MPRFLTGRPEGRGKKSRAGLFLVFVVVIAAAVPVAILHGFVIGCGQPYQSWVPAHPATAAEPLLPGGLAADFTLPLVNGRQTVRLADLRRGGKPVVLIFSSFTCDFFTHHQGYLKELHRAYRDRAEFLMVVVREARHELPGLEFLLTTPADHEHRHRLVRQAMDVQRWTIPTVMDTEASVVESAYKAFPLRLAVVNPAGRIDFATRFTAGTFGLDRQGLARWFDEHLGEATPADESDTE